MALPDLYDEQKWIHYALAHSYGVGAVGATRRDIDRHWAVQNFNTWMGTGLYPQACLLWSVVGAATDCLP
jgi:hypothetical protein